MKNDGIFVATFVFKNGQLPTFFGHLATFEKFLSEFLVKNGIDKSIIRKIRHSGLASVQKPEGL